MVLKLRFVRAGIHVRATHFMGEDRDHLANCGETTMREPEFDALVQTLRVGAAHAGNLLVLVEERG